MLGTVARLEPVGQLVYHIQYTAGGATELGRLLVHVEAVPVATGMKVVLQPALEAQEAQNALGHEGSIEDGEVLLTQVCPVSLGVFVVEYRGHVFLTKQKVQYSCG